jgi:NhaP-type Na+/H+ or K+/H+ antiporter
MAATTAVLDHPTLTFALAMTIGVFAQALARHLYIPGVVVLLFAGVLLGPEVAGVIRPHVLGSALSAVVGFAVAVILFEGGLNLELRVLRWQAKPIRRLVLLGGLVTGLGATLACRAILGWDWRLSALFGTLVIVTGPTVITPLVRRIRLKTHVAAILEAEGVFIDAIGATIAVVALQVAIAPSGEALGAAALGIAARLGTGAAVGAAGGSALALLLHRPNVVPRGLENILALAVAILLFQLSEGLVPESGIPAAIAAGMVVGNGRSHALSEIAEFKEQLTVLLIGTLFVLLAADIPLGDVVALGYPGLGTVLALMFVVRPLTVFVSTFGTTLSVREKLFLSWLAPRGIVAAAVSSLFALQLTDAGIPGGAMLKALVFMVIATTVTVQGLSGGQVARLLGVRRAENSGYIVLGANPLARHVARHLSAGGEEVVLLDANADECRAAQAEGFQVLAGNALDSATLARVRPDTRIACVGLTSNEDINLQFARMVLEEFRGPRAYVAIEGDATGVTADSVLAAGARVLFGAVHHWQDWQARWRGDGVEVAWYVREPGAPDEESLARAPRADILPIVLRRGDELSLIDSSTRAQPGDRVEFAVAADHRQRAYEWLRAAGWSRVEPGDGGASVGE